MRYQIGIFDFATVVGQPVPPVMRAETITRAGVHGTGLFQTGRRGEPFELITERDTTTADAARRLFVQYTTTVNAGAYALVWRGQSMDAEGWRVIVARVDPLEISALLGASGGLLNGTGRGVVKAKWTLIGVPL